jgi:hypothetical protein
MTTKYALETNYDVWYNELALKEFLFKGSLIPSQVNESEVHRRNEVCKKLRGRISTLYMLRFWLWLNKYVKSR